MAAERVLVARVGAAQGLRGEVRLWAFTADPMAVKGYGPLETDDGRRLALEALRPGKSFLVARFAGVSDRTAAEKLTNLDLYVPRDRLPATGAEEFYHADLIGLAAVTASGNRLGTVVAAHDFGAGDLLEIRPDIGPTLMIPFTAAVVPSIDVAGGRIVVDPPEGLLPSPAGADEAPEA
jgi:16S rRNA processing protein RimM